LTGALTWLFSTLGSSLSCIHLGIRLYITLVDNLSGFNLPPYTAAAKQLRNKVLVDLLETNLKHHF
jgi:hypothetical protein